MVTETPRARSRAARRLTVVAAAFVCFCMSPHAQTPAPLADGGGKISERLRALPAETDRLAVFVELQSKPHRGIRQQVDVEFGARLDAARSWLKETIRIKAPHAVVENARREWMAAATEARDRANQAIKAALAPEQDRVEALLMALGATGIHRYRSLNMLKADVPAWTLADIAAHPDVAHVSPVGVFEGTANRKPRDSVEWLGAPELWGPDFSGITGFHGPPLAVIDSGIDETHPAFEGKLVEAHAFLVAAQNHACWGNEDDTSTNDAAGHGTAIADIAAGRAKWLGVAPNLNRFEILYSLKVLFKADRARCPNANVPGVESDLFLALDFLDQNRPFQTDLIVNLSLGFDVHLTPTWVDYENIARRVDEFIHNNSPYVTVVVAGGNRGDMPGGPGADSVETPGIAYNVITVAMADSRGKGDRIHKKSSRGPTRGGRSKPDIAAPGVNIMAAKNGGYAGNFGGSSAAAPHIAGAVALLAEALGTGHNLVLKAVLLNEARRPGLITTTLPAWRNDRGWGFASLRNLPNLLAKETDDAPCQKDGAKAQAYRTFCFTDEVSDLPGDEFRFYQGTASNQFSATVVWDLRFPTVTPPPSLGDIDLFLYEKLPAGYTRADSSISPADNVEHVELTANSADVIVKVKLARPANASDAVEPYALAVSSGLKPALPPKLQVGCGGPLSAAPSQQVGTTCTVINIGGLPVEGVQALAVAPASIVNPSLGTIGPGQSRLFTVTITVPATPGPSLTTNITAFGELADEGFGGGTAIIVNVEQPTDCTIVIPHPGPVIVPATGASGTLPLNTAPTCQWNVAIFPAKGEFSMQPVPNWIVISPMSGTGSLILNYTVLPNTLGEPVTGIINVDPAPGFSGQGAGVAFGIMP